MSSGTGKLAECVRQGECEYVNRNDTRQGPEGKDREQSPAGPSSRSFADGGGRVLYFWLFPIPHCVVMHS